VEARCHPRQIPACGFRWRGDPDKRRLEILVVRAITRVVLRPRHHHLFRKTSMRVELEARDIVIKTRERISLGPITKRNYLRPIPHYPRRTVSDQLLAIRMPASLRTSLTHGEQSWEENTVLPKNNPLRFGRVKCIGEKRMPVRIA
jgi:hypothetical protein